MRRLLPSREPLPRYVAEEAIGAASAPAFKVLVYVLSYGHRQLLPSGEFVAWLEMPREQLAGRLQLAKSTVELAEKELSALGYLLIHGSQRKGRGTPHAVSAFLGYDDAGANTADTPLDRPATSAGTMDEENTRMPGTFSQGPPGKCPTVGHLTAAKARKTPDSRALSPRALGSPRRGEPVVVVVDPDPRDSLIINNNNNPTREENTRQSGTFPSGLIERLQATGLAKPNDYLDLGPERIELALEEFDEQMRHGRIRNPGGLMRTLLEDVEALVWRRKQQRLERGSLDLTFEERKARYTGGKLGQFVRWK